MTSSGLAFNHHQVFKAYPCLNMCQYSIPLYGRITFPCVNIPFNSWLVPTFWLLRILLIRASVYRFLCGMYFHFSCVYASQEGNCWVTLRLFNLVRNYFRMHKGSNFSTFFQHLLLPVFFIITCPSECEVKSHYSVNLNFSNGQWCWQFLMCLLATRLSSMEKCLLSPLLLHWVVFLSCCKISLYTNIIMLMYSGLLLDAWCLNFFPLCGLFVHFLDSVLWGINLFYLLFFLRHKFKLWWRPSYPCFSFRPTEGFGADHLWTALWETRRGFKI